MRPILALLGPTAAGKSEIALRIAEDLEAVILSVDSMQVYRGMDIGTAKPTPADRERVPHLMIDLVEPEEPYAVAQFRSAAHRHLATLGDRPVMVVGGSGLHFRAVVDPLRFPPHDPATRAGLEATPVEALRSELLAADPNATTHIDLANPRRLRRAVEVLRLTGATPSQRAATEEAAALRDYRSERQVVVAGVDPGEGLQSRIEARLNGMMEAGLLAEVTSLAGRLGPTARLAVGYRQLLPVVVGETTSAHGVSEARRATLAVARRQRTFFRRDPRIRWVPWSDDPARRVQAVREVLLG